MQEARCRRRCVSSEPALRYVLIDVLVELGLRDDARKTLEASVAKEFLVSTELAQGARHGGAHGEGLRPEWQ
jgi:hypothetical protein